MGEIVHFNSEQFTLSPNKAGVLLGKYKYKWFRVRVNTHPSAWLTDLEKGQYSHDGAEGLMQRIKLLMPGIHVEHFTEDSHTRLMIEGDCPNLSQDQIQTLCDKIGARILKFCYNADMRTPTIKAG